MPSYRFTGAFPRVLTGLTEGVNAHHEGTRPGATVEPEPGDEVTTAVPYPHVELELLDEAAQPPAAPLYNAGGVLPPGLTTATNTTGEPIPVTPAPEPITLTADEVAHLTPEVLAQIHAAEDPNPSAPAPETQE